MTSVSKMGWGAKSVDVLVEGSALTAEVTDKLVEGGVLGTVTGAVLAAGWREEHQGLWGSTARDGLSLAPPSPVDALEHRFPLCSEVFGRDRSLRGSPRLCGSRGTPCVRGAWNCPRPVSSSSGILSARWCRLGPFPAGSASGTTGKQRREPNGPPGSRAWRASGAAWPGRWRRPCTSGNLECSCRSSGGVSSGAVVDHGGLGLAVESVF